MRLDMRFEVWFDYGRYKHIWLMITEYVSVIENVRIG